MPVTIEAINADQFGTYGAIPAWFEVRTLFRVEVADGGLGGFRLVEEAVEPFIRCHSAPPEDGPTRWATQFDIRRWGFFLGVGDEGRPLGGAAVALDAAVYPMDRFQRHDLAVLWDIRVHPDYRRQGIGALLFRHACDWARDRGYGQLGMETDSSNVGACRFYARQGCSLGAIHRFGYVGVPEVARYAMLLWYLGL